jgi:non-ribosomal peptide synthase protein (TIGR01720 family)
VFGALLADLGAHEPRRLLLAAHHLVIDAVSWRILVEDLELAYDALTAGEPIVLPAKTSSFKTWAERLHDYADSEQALAELAFWTRQGEGEVARLLPDTDTKQLPVDSLDLVEVSLSAEQTEALLRDVPRVYRTQINDILLTALALAVCRLSGSSSVSIDLEGHGREQLFANVDLSRTVGWFTSLFPVLLELPDPSDLGACLKAVKETLRSLPERGIGYGILRYLSNEAGAALLAELPAAEISFNYLGQFGTEQQVGAFPSLAGFQGAQVAPSNPGSHPITINGAISAGQLQMGIAYASTLLSPEQAERLATGFEEALGELIEHCLEPGAGGYTPSDFPLAGLGHDELAELLKSAARGSGSA